MIPEIIYLTDSIFIKDGKTHYKEEKIIKEIKVHNWHHILCECGWSKIHKKWISILNKESIIKTKNSLYGVLDCDSDGNCFFHCIANALNDKELYFSNEYYDQNDVRKMLADSITEEKFNELINYYKIMKDADDFDEEWDPYSIETVDDFKEELMKSGHNYWGDWLLLDILCKTLKLNIFILNTDTMNNLYTVYNTMINYQTDYNTIFLAYEDSSHFQLIGYFNGDRILSYFTEKQIPIELKRICKIVR